MSQIQQYAIDTINQEARAVSKLLQLLTPDFEAAVRAILACKGRVVVTGMGKSGLVGKKIAATLASTGTPAFFMHPGEAFHGDLGMVSPQDIVIAIANSGQTDELLRLIPFFESRGNQIIAMTGNVHSTLARHARFVINTAVEEEACPLNLAPTSSTTTTMVMGDALAIALMKEREFKEEDYAVFHPGGSLGRRLLTKVGDVMRASELPYVTPHTTLDNVILAISNARMGLAVVISEEDKARLDTRAPMLLGVISDGDIRRAMTKYRQEFFTTPAHEVMSTRPKTVDAKLRIVFAEEIMHKNRVHSLIVVDAEQRVQGILEYFNVSATV